MRSTVKREDTAARQAARSISPIRSIASTAASRLSTRKPVTPSSISSGIDPRLQAMTGVPQASASTTDRPNGSSKLMRWSNARADPLHQLQKPLPVTPIQCVPADLVGQCRSDRHDPTLLAQFDCQKAPYGVIMGCGGRQVVYCPGFHQSLQCAGVRLIPTR